VQVVPDEAAAVATASATRTVASVAPAASRSPRIPTQRDGHAAEGAATEREQDSGHFPIQIG
jgi:hypothetical protein